MRGMLAVLVVVGLSVGVADADDNTLTPENDVRLAKLSDAKPQKIGVLTYYPNKGGGYTFLEGEQIAFYALPHLPSTYQLVETRLVMKNRAGPIIVDSETVTIFTTGKSEMPFGGQTLYRPGRRRLPDNCRPEHIPVAIWSRGTPDGKFQLSIMDENRESRLKLKSIVPVLENASKHPVSRP